jgi:hypothetical protein
VGILLLVRTVVLPLARDARDALDDALGLDMPVDDMEDPNVDERLEKRVEDSEGT